MTIHNFYESNVSNIAWTPRDYQVEILSSANERNIIISLSQNPAKEFCALKLIQELSHQLRRPDNRKISLFLTSSPYAYNLIHYLTDLKVINLNDEENEEEIVWENLNENQVIILQTEKCRNALDESLIDINNVNLIIIDDCHQSNRMIYINDIFTNHFRKAVEKPKIFGLAGPIHNAQCNPARLGAELEYLESLMSCKVETASDIVTVLRYSLKPIEIIAECAAPTDNDLASYVRQLIIERRNFIVEHRYDPSEIYGEYKDELANIPDPKEEPLKIIDEFLNLLNELGVYCADKAAFTLLMHLEKLKIKTPYERHYLLLCLVSSTLIQVRSFIDKAFQVEGTEKERIEKYSTPKVHRILEILKVFKPEKISKPQVKREISHENLEKCDSPKCLELLKDLNIDNLNALELEASEKIKRISETLENVKATIAKINPNATTLTPTVQTRPHRNHRGKKGRRFYHRPRHHNNPNEVEALCGLIFCDSLITAKTLFCLFCEVSRNDTDLKFLNVQYTVNKTADPITEPKESEAEHRKQEEVLKKFRMHECNLLITTAVLEEGFDLPKCNLVIRWDPPKTYRSYVQCKGRAKTANALHVIMIAPPFKLDTYNIDVESNKNHKMICDIVRQRNEDSDDDSETDSESSTTSTPEVIEKCVIEMNDDVVVEKQELYENVEFVSSQMIDKMAEYMEIEKMLIKNCENKEPPSTELAFADKFTSLIQPYQPLSNPDSPQVTLATSIALLNKYCAKLPSDTFTKLTPIWRCCKTTRNGFEMYQYTIRLPLNSPMKHDIVGIPMPTRTLARRIASLIACRILHKTGELDDNLQPIGKEGFRAIEPDWEFFELDKADEKVSNDENEPRPGTTKRRQYYYKRIASVFSNCRPTTQTKAYLYHITMILQCPIPEEQNTRGRKIYPPEEAVQSFGILTTKRIPCISAFPIFTRSGEVKVSLQLIERDVILNEIQLGKINNFINYTFTNVLRLRKYLMLFDPEAVENSFFVVPVTKETGRIEVDWNFLTAIQNSSNIVPSYVSDEERKDKPFDYNKFKDAVVMPWYRNQDQPQYFYVAEICYKLSPESDFPGESYKTFHEYYFKKYNIQIQNKTQPLLDVDHTSARLNFLTPRYVNRKGVALPTSSEETKRAKRENLEQKQILVPELCTVHPFPASLWRAAVCLPCVLYRINALLLADEIRMEVSVDLGLGTLEIKDENFEWPMLDFGWTLADVLKKTREAKVSIVEEGAKIEEITDEVDKELEEIEDNKKDESKDDEKSANDKLEEIDEKAKWLDIGTWSNEMAKNVANNMNGGILPDNLELCSTNKIRYGSPTSWEGACVPRSANSTRPNLPNIYASDSDDFDTDEDNDDSPDYEEDDAHGLKIEFKNDHLAEAVETEEEMRRRQKKMEFLEETIAIQKYYEMMKNKTSGFDFIDEDNFTELEEKIAIHEMNFEKSIAESKKLIKSSGVLVKQDEKIPLKIRQSVKNDIEESNGKDVDFTDLVPYIDKNEIAHFLENDSPLTLDDLYEINEIYTNRHPNECFEVVGSGDIFDNFADSDRLKIKENNTKVVQLQIKNDLEKFSKSKKENLEEKITRIMNPVELSLVRDNKQFSFDYQPDLNNHPGPSPSIILQALTMSNANDGINLERLETIGDSFLKYSITTYLYCTYENVNEGKLSYLRSKQVSNLNLYRLGRRKILGESMIATKFEPHDNWLPPCYFVPKELEQALIDAKIPVCYWNLADLPDIKQLSSEEICNLVRQRAEKLGMQDDNNEGDENSENNESTPVKKFPQMKAFPQVDGENYPCFIPYNLVTQHSIPDKSIADCVEALIGAYLIECGTRGALLFMAWLGIRVLPIVNVPIRNERIPGSTKSFEEDGILKQTLYGHWIPPKSPLLRCIPDPEGVMNRLLNGFEKFEEDLNYKFRDRSYLLQAMTHASYSPNRLTDCYQRLEFLGDAVLDYLITRHLYEDSRQHSPGALTDLRSALVNNTIFASLAVRHNFHKYFLHLSPPLNDVIARFVRIQHENGHNICEEYYLLNEEECDEAEDVEVPKALGDVFESIAGAIFLDSGMSLDAVWRVYYRMMGPEIEQFSCSVPKSPIRELLELEPETAKFGKPEKLADGRRVRVTVEVFGKGIFRGIGRNYRIAKCTAAKCALRQLKKNNMINKKH